MRREGSLNYKSDSAPITISFINWEMKLNIFVWLVLALLAVNVVARTHSGAAHSAAVSNTDPDFLKLDNYVSRIREIFSSRRSVSLAQQSRSREYGQLSTMQYGFQSFSVLPRRYTVSKGLQVIDFTLMKESNIHIYLTHYQ